MQGGRKVLRKGNRPVVGPDCRREEKCRRDVKPPVFSPSHECSIIPAPSARQGRKRPCCFDETSAQRRRVQAEGANLSRPAATRTTTPRLLLDFFFFVLHYDEENLQQAE